MATLKTNQIISCTNIVDARVKADKISNAIIIVKDKDYLLVNYKTFIDLLPQGYVQIR